MSDMTGTIEISKAIHALLSGHEEVQTVLGSPPRLYDNPPEDPVFPYLTYGPMRSEDISADGALMSAHTLTLHIWSRYGGRAQVMEILAVVTGVLQGGGLTLEGISLVRAQISLYGYFPRS